MNAQASTEGAKTLYHEQDKQAEDVFFFKFVRKRLETGEDTTHKYSKLPFFASMQTPPEINESVEKHSCCIFLDAYLLFG